MGYSTNSKAFRVYNTSTRHVEENLHVNFLENIPNMKGKGPNWLFDIDSLTSSLNYQANPHACQEDINGSAGTQDSVDAEKTDITQQYIVLPLISLVSPTPENSATTNY